MNLNVSLHDSYELIWVMEDTFENKIRRLELNEVFTLITRSFHFVYNIIDFSQKNVLYVERVYRFNIKFTKSINVREHLLYPDLWLLS